MSNSIFTSRYSGEVAMRGEGPDWNIIPVLKPWKDSGGAFGRGTVTRLGEVRLKIEIALTRERMWNFSEAAE